MVSLAEKEEKQSEQKRASARTLHSVLLSLGRSLPSACVIVCNRYLVCAVRAEVQIFMAAD